jgi:hypothetical protein
MDAEPPMARILKFSPGRDESPARIDAARVWEYVRPRLDFPLPDFITKEIDRVIGEIWNESEAEMDFHECVNALQTLQGRDIMIPFARRELIVTLIFEFLERHGYLYRTE